MAYFDNGNLWYVMDVQEMIRALRGERDRIDKVISALERFAGTRKGGGKRRGPTQPRGGKPRSGPKRR